MSDQITLRLSQNERRLANVEWDGHISALVLGRLQSRDETRYLITRDAEPRLPFAGYRDNQYSRSHVQISKIAAGKIKIHNICAASVPIFVAPSTTLGPDESAERMLPTTLTIGDYSFRIERALNSLSRQTRFHRDFEPEFSSQSHLAVEDTIVSSDDSILIDQLSKATSVLQQATTKEDLFQKAIAVVTKLLGMDAAAIVNAHDRSEVFSVEPIEPDQSAIQDVCQSRRVNWSSSERGSSSNDSNSELDYFIGAPIVVSNDNVDEIHSVLYAHRSTANAMQSQRKPLRKIHAQIFEMVACSVAAGLVRFDHQATQGRFEQFFTPALARQLMKGDELLKPCQREVTIMFVDIRRFSSISEKLGPAETSAWVQDVMSELSDCVINHEGVLVDYIGDELMAMWGAPADQPDHAERACRCAEQMMTVMPVLNRKWLDRIGDETVVGIGINSGMANVGNTGSKYKFKYGPLGDAVNRASRVQGLTKYLRVDAILTGDTWEKLGEGFKTRRLGKASVVNIDKTIDLFELSATQNTESPEIFTRYEAALKHLEEGQLQLAASLLKEALNFETPDHPTMLVMNEIINRSINGQHEGVFEWNFDKK